MSSRERIREHSHPLMMYAGEELGRLVSAAVLGKVLDDAALAEVRRAIIRHRAKWLHAGVEFPRMTALPLFAQGRVLLYREDFTRQQVQRTALQLRHEFPKTTELEVTEGIKHAWPDKWVNGRSAHGALRRGDGRAAGGEAGQGEAGGDGGGA